MSTRKKSDSIKKPRKKRTGKDVYIGKFVHQFNHKWQDHEIEALADEIYEFASRSRSKVFLNTFLAKKGINRQRIAEFKENKYFDYIYSLVKEFFEERLFERGTTMAIFALKNNYQWKDKQEIDHHSPVPIRFIENIPE